MYICISQRNVRWYINNNIHIENILKFDVSKIEISKNIAFNSKILIYRYLFDFIENILKRTFLNKYKEVTLYIYFPKLLFKLSLGSSLYSWIYQIEYLNVKISIYRSSRQVPIQCRYINIFCEFQYHFSLITCGKIIQYYFHSSFSRKPTLPQQYPMLSYFNLNKQREF